MSRSRARLLAAVAVSAAVAAALTPRIRAGAYIFAGEANGVDVVTHPNGYTGTGGTLEVGVCIDSTSVSAASMVIPVQNIVNRFNARVATTGNLVSGVDSELPSTHFDWESVTLHEVGHCVGMAHPNLASESGLGGADQNYTKSTDGADNTFNLGIGADGVRGSSDDIRGDDVNLHYFRRSNNNPFTIDSPVDSTTYSRNLGDLPAGHSFAANGDRSVSTLLGVPDTEAVMQQGTSNDEEQRTLTHDDVATLEYAMSGLDEIAGNADDYTLVLRYRGRMAGDCGVDDIKIDFDNVETGFAVCQTGGFFIGATDHVRVSTANVFLNSSFNWFYNAELATDLAITKTDGQATVTAGSPISYTITVTNNGPARVTSVRVTDNVPAAILSPVFTPSAGSYDTGTGDWTGLDLSPGQSATLTLSGTVDAGASGSLVNTATVQPLTGRLDVDEGANSCGTGVGFDACALEDENSSNDSATDTNTILNPQADLSVTKTDGVGVATPGTQVTYTIVASNAGPASVTGATVADDFPGILSCTWTCAGSGGGSCTASGSGDISDTVDLPVSGSVTYTATCAIASSASGSLANTATVSLPGGMTDPTPGNDSATDTDTLTPSADLSIAKSDGLEAVIPGQTVQYTITAQNAGPSDVGSATVTDTLPSELVSASWTCSGAGGGTCAASGSGDISDTAGLPAGATVTYVLSATVSGSASGTVENTASVSGGAVSDPSPGDESATDTDTVATGSVLTARFLMPGQIQTATLSSGTTSAWFRTRLEAGRSYAVYAWAPATDAGVEAPDLSEVAFYTDAGATAATAVTATDQEVDLDVPTEFQQVQTKIVPSTSGEHYLELSAASAPTNAYDVRVVLVETTLYSPWWFVSGPNGYDGFIEIRNDSAEPVSVTVTAYDPGGSVTGTPSTQAVPGNGTVLVQVGVTLGAPDGFGSAQIAHTGPPGAISANITTLSATTGLSFDAPFAPRMDWSTLPTQ